MCEHHDHCTVLARKKLKAWDHVCLSASFFRGSLSPVALFSGSSWPSIVSRLLSCFCASFAHSCCSFFSLDSVVRAKDSLQLSFTKGGEKVMGGEMELQEHRAQSSLPSVPSCSGPSAVGVHGSLLSCPAVYQTLL